MRFSVRHKSSQKIDVLLLLLFFILFATLMNVHIWKGLVFRYCRNTRSAHSLLTVRYRGFRLIDIYLCGRFESNSFQCSAKNSFIREIEFNVFVGDAKWKPIRNISMASSIECQTNRCASLKIGEGSSRPYLMTDDRLIIFIALKGLVRAALLEDSD